MAPHYRSDQWDDGEDAVILANDEDDGGEEDDGDEFVAPTVGVETLALADDDVVQFREQHDFQAMFNTWRVLGITVNQTRGVAMGLARAPIVVRALYSNNNNVADELSRFGNIRETRIVTRRGARLIWTGDTTIANNPVREWSTVIAQMMHRGGDDSDSGESTGDSIPDLIPARVWRRMEEWSDNSTSLDISSACMIQRAWRHFRSVD